MTKKKKSTKDLKLKGKVQVIKCEESTILISGDNNYISIKGKGNFIKNNDKS